MARHCAKPVCDNLAAATLSYQYDNASVWIEHLHVEDHPMLHDLCMIHADAMTVPRGWSLADLRVAHPGALPKAS
ncbi:MAG: DUF3499 family protein [Acidimicrobiales bacterium]